MDVYRCKGILNVANSDMLHMLQVHLFYHSIYWSENKSLMHFKSHLKLFPFGLCTRVRCLEGCEGDL